MNYLTVSLSREIWSGLSAASGSGSITTVQSRCLLGLWSQLKIRLEEVPLLVSSLTWRLAGLRTSKPNHVTVGRRKVLGEYWPEMIVSVHLGLSVQLHHGSSFPQRQQRREQEIGQVEATVSS